MDNRNLIVIGAMIKSFDFAGHDDCYLIGTVEDIDETDGLIRGKIIRRVLEGERVELKSCGDRFATPLPGHMLFDFDDRIQVLA